MASAESSCVAVVFAQVLRCSTVDQTLYCTDQRVKPPNERAMGEAVEHWRALSEDRQPLIDSCAATEEELEAEAFWIQNSLKFVLDAHAPGKAACARSK